jgi:hypothetical protein
MAFDPAITDQCLADTTTDAACIGAAANQCMTDTLGGTGGGPATAQCLMQLTAEQTLRLEAGIRP